MLHWSCPEFVQFKAKTSAHVTRSQRRISEMCVTVTNVTSIYCDLEKNTISNNYFYFNIKTFQLYLNLLQTQIR